MTTTTSDPISDMLTRIRNAALVHKNEVMVPHSKAKEAVAQILQSNNFLDKVAITGDGIEKAIKITINDPDESARITQIVRLSKPGRRQYANAAGIPTVKSGRGIVILSTSKGIMTGKQAKDQNIGGELICRVY